MNLQVKRALISVYEKSSVIPFAQELHHLGVEIISTGGTAEVLQATGLPVTLVEDLTGFREMLEGRVKTLHPAVHASLLVDRRKPSHLRQLEEKGWKPIDLVVLNLYPFCETVSRPGVELEEALEMIDIGGPAMLRSAAKNWQNVAVVVDPQDYPLVLQYLRQGGIPEEIRRRLAIKAFATTSRYDAEIQRFLEQKEGEDFPHHWILSLERERVLRYGENPHQKGALYLLSEKGEGTVAGAEQISGKDLSFTNLLDLSSALELVSEFDRPSACIVKHTNPCGCAVADELAPAFIAARDADPVSRFGGIIACNCKVDVATAQEIIRGDLSFETTLRVPRPRGEELEVPLLSKGSFYEAIIAPDYDPLALELLQTRKGWGANIRILRCGDLRGNSRKSAWVLRSISGGILVEEADTLKVDPSQFQVVSRRKPSEEEWSALLFAWVVCKHIKSNAIVLAKRDAGSGKVLRLVGMGAGQPNRLVSVALAIQQAGDQSIGSVLASDAFFPKPDGPELAAKAGVTAIIQPGGAKEDDKVIDVADRYGLAMVFTGTRHFLH